MFRVDDRFILHPKVMAIPSEARLEAVGLWALVGAWSAGQLQGGEVSSDVLQLLGGEQFLPPAAEHLIDVGLWHGPEHECPRCREVRPGYFLFHDWDDHNPPPEGRPW